MGSPHLAPSPGWSPSAAAKVDSCCRCLRGIDAFWHPVTAIATATVATFSRSFGRNCAGFAVCGGPKHHDVEPRTDQSARWPGTSYRDPLLSISVCPGVKIDKCV